MRFEPFKLERYFADWEFTAPYLLSSSDPESMRLTELLEYASPADRARWDEAWLGYTESAGMPELRAAIAARYPGIEPHHVTVFAAPEEAIFHHCNARLAPGDHLIGLLPSYQSSYEIPRAIGAEVTLLPLRPELGWQPDLIELVGAIRPNTQMIYLNSPHNPTGSVLPARSLEAILQIAARHDLDVLSDEMYRGLEFDPADQLPAAATRYRRAVSLGGMSKVYGLPGLRLGWTVCLDEAINERMVAAKDYTTICSPGPSELLTLIAVRATDQLIARTMDRTRANLELVDAFFEKWSQLFSWVRPKAGTLGFPQLRADIPVETFCRDLVREDGVLLVPGGVFDHPGNHFRIGFGRANLPTALDHFDAHLTRAYAGTATR